MLMSFHRKSRFGFTLIELAIVLSIAGLLFVGRSRAPDAAQRHQRVHARLRRAMAVPC